MRPRIKVITLAVRDLEESLTFYRDGMGLPTQGIIGTEFEDGAVVFFNMNEDLILALYPQAALAKDAQVSVSPPRSEEHTSELQSRQYLVCRLLLEKKKA